MNFLLLLYKFHSFRPALFLFEVSCYFWSHVSSCWKPRAKKTQAAITAPQLSLAVRNSCTFWELDHFQRIAIFAFRFLNGNSPPYLSSCPSVYIPSWTLRSSSDEQTLSCARRKLEGFGYRSLSFPVHIWHCSCVSQFKTSKIFIFASACS